MHTIKKMKSYWSCALLIAAFSLSGRAQTNNDAIMMNKHQFCNGISYAYSTWTSYWEGTLKRTNENLGRVTTQALMYMPNYGITDNLNVMAGVPYVWTHACGDT
jgi:hypothetical protein